MKVKIGMKYPKIRRIPIAGIKLKGKRYLTDKEVDELVSGEVIVEEKLDGMTAGISFSNKNGLPVLQTHNRIIRHNETGFEIKEFIAWAYKNIEKIAKIPENHIIFGEWLYYKHSIFYNKLPDNFIAFDVWCKNCKKFIYPLDQALLLNGIGIKHSPIIVRGKPEFDPRKLVAAPFTSYFSDSKAEGIVIKNHEKQLFGKYVFEEFEENIEDHWTKGKLVRNKVVEN